MPPKGKQTKKPVKKVYDYSGLKEGMTLQALSEDGVYYAAEVLLVSTSKNREKAPVKIHYKNYGKEYDEWVSGDKLRSKALKVVKPEKPESPMKQLEFNFGYWKIRGLGSIFRMIFEYKGVKYTDNQYEGKEGADKWFKEDKPKILEKNVLANLPYLECGKDCVCQTNACLSYLGRRLKLNGVNYKASLLNEQLLCEIYDVRNTIIDISYPFRKVCRDESEHKTKSEEQISSSPFKKFEASLASSGTDFFCGKTPCTSDFHIWEMLDQHKLLAAKHGTVDIFADIPKCKAFYDKFRALPSLEKYFASDAYKFPVNNPIASAYFQ